MQTQAAALLLPLLIKTNREGKRENYTKLTAVALESYQYSS